MQAPGMARPAMGFGGPSLGPQQPMQQQQQYAQPGGPMQQMQQPRPGFAPQSFAQGSPQPGLAGPGVSNGPRPSFASGPGPNAAFPGGQQPMMQQQQPQQQFARGPAPAGGMAMGPGMGGNSMMPPGATQPQQQQQQPQQFGGGPRPFQQQQAQPQQLQPGGMMVPQQAGAGPRPLGVGGMPGQQQQQPSLGPQQHPQPAFGPPRPGFGPGGPGPMAQPGVGGGGAPLGPQMGQGPAQGGGMAGMMGPRGPLQPQQQQPQLSGFPGQQQPAMGGPSMGQQQPNMGGPRPAGPGPMGMAQGLPQQQQQQQQLGPGSMAGGLGPRPFAQFGGGPASGLGQQQAPAPGGMPPQSMRGGPGFQQPPQAGGPPGQGQQGNGPFGGAPASLLAPGGGGGGPFQQQQQQPQGPPMSQQGHPMPQQFPPQGPPRGPPAGMMGGGPSQQGMAPGGGGAPFGQAQAQQGPGQQGQPPSGGGFPFGGGGGPFGSPMGGHPGPQQQGQPGGPGPMGQGMGPGASPPPGAFPGPQQGQMLLGGGPGQGGMGSPQGMMGMGGAPQPQAASVAEVDERAACHPSYMAFTMGAMPVNSGLAVKAGLPFGLAVHPLAEGEGSLGRGGIPVVNFGAAGVIRCKRCRAYINPFVKFADGGRRWRCNICTYINDVPPAYFAPTDADGVRVDAAQRPELSTGSVEFIAPVEYMIRPPQAPVYVFVIDVSFGAVQSGMLATAVQTIKACLEHLPGDERTQVGFVTYDSAVQFYSLKAGLHAPQMLVVPDVDELFMPVPEELLVNLSEARPLVEQLLGALPGMFASNRTMESCLGPALDAAYNVMQHIGGKMVVMQTVLPSVGVGKLKPREAPKMLGSEKEHTLLAPDPGDDGSFYKTKAVDFSRQQISVDMFLFAHNYTDVATLGALSRYTAGQVYYYPSFNGPTDSERFARDLTRDLTRTTGFEAVMRIRCTKGVNITNFYGNFFIRGTDLLALPNVSSDTAFNVELAHEEALAPGSVVAVQAALLYTTSGGERRIAVHTLAKPVTSVLGDLFRGVGADAVANMLAKVALDHALRHGIHMARKYLHRTIVELVRAYRAASAASSYGPGGGGGMGQMQLGGPSSTRPLPSMPGGGPGGQGGGAPGGPGNDPSTMLPEHLALLPLFALGLQKCTLYRGGDAIRSDERASLVYRMLTMPTTASRLYIYPRMYSLHDMDDGAGRPDPAAAAAQSGGPAPLRLPSGVLNLSAERLNPAGVFLLDDGVEMFLWVGRAAPPPLLQALFGAPSLEGVDPASIALPQLENDYSARVNGIVNQLREGATQAQRLRVVREGAGDASEARFHWHMVEDRQAFTGGAVSYAEYLAIVLRESQMSAGTMGGAPGGQGPA